MTDREYARIVPKAMGREYVERPERIACNRKARRAKRRDSVTGDFFEYLLATREVFGELVRRQVINQPVPIAVAANFVPCFLNITNQKWVAVGDPAEYEKRGPNLKLFEQRQNTVRVLHHATFVLV